MLPLATSTVSTCGYYCGEAVVVVHFHDRLECHDPAVACVAVNTIQSHDSGTLLASRTHTCCTAW